jgi:hypothetical protein
MTEANNARLVPLNKATWWTPTGGLYAIAAAVAAVAIVLGVSSSPARRYEFATAQGLGVWRGDMTTGEAVLCVNGDMVQAIAGGTSELAHEYKGLAKKC